jgi:tRNA(adenine34) deaminase
MNEINFMSIALAEAQLAFERGEYPVGAVLVRGDEIVAKAGNRCVADVDPTAHAEVLVIREGYKKLRSVSDCTLYTTLYPCPMCEKTIVEVGIRHVVYGATSFKWIREHKYVHLVPEFTGPVMQTQCRELFEKRLEENGRNDILDFERL